MYPYFAVVAGLAWSNDPESDGSGTIAAARTSSTGQFKGDDSDKRYTLVCQVGGWGEADKLTP
jgi:hypothetical protein